MLAESVDPKRFKTLCDEIYRRNFEPYLSGRKELFMGLMAGYFCKGHVLIEGPPGTAKTLLAKIFAKTLGKSFKRIQFTNDLQPEKITGHYYFHPGKGDYKFLPGPLFADILLADEINRAPPVTQSAFLEAMEERQVTVKGSSIDLGDTFFVIATQNPADYEGTFPLPEVQLDRFLFSFSLNHLTRDEEVEVIQKHLEGRLPPNFHAMPSLEVNVLEIQQMIRKVTVHKSLINYAADVVHLTRTSGSFVKGAGLRAILAMIKGAQVGALIEGRTEAIPQDIFSFALPALRHRLNLSQKALDEDDNIEAHLMALIRKVPIPEITLVNKVA